MTPVVFTLIDFFEQQACFIFLEAQQVEAAMFKTIWRQNQNYS